MILDVMLPGIDGFAVMSHLRAAGEFVPTLMLTARNRAEDVLKGFESGADDYLPKPFELSILLARIHGLSGAAAGSNGSPLAIFSSSTAESSTSTTSNSAWETGSCNSR